MTRLHWYYGPLRRPKRPGLSLTSCQLIPNCDHRWGFPCCVWSPLPTCRRHYPGRSDGVCSLVYLHRQRPSLCNSQVGSCNYFFGACSAFTHVTACTLAESPCDPLHRKLRRLRCLRRRFDCYRVERTSSRAGVAPAEVQRLSRRTFSTTIRSNVVRGMLLSLPHHERHIEGATTKGKMAALVVLCILLGAAAEGLAQDTRQAAYPKMAE